MSADTCAVIKVVSAAISLVCNAAALVIVIRMNRRKGSP